MPDVAFPFPINGKDESGPVSSQPEFTSPDLKNVRPYDTAENRIRGGQRPGVQKFLATCLDAPIMAMVSITTTQYEDS